MTASIKALKKLKTLSKIRLTSKCRWANKNLEKKKSPHSQASIVMIIISLLTDLCFILIYAQISNF
jgi:hypothetical protein